MKINIKGTKKSVVLQPKDYIAGGGEGDVYAKDGIAYKLYKDPGKMIPEGKIADLSGITAPNVIRPLDVICDDQGGNLGYTMNYVKDTLTLCQLFPRSFKEREGLSPQKVLDLVRGMQADVQGIHKADVLIVDLNEMNTLVSKDFTKAFWIDVDSYQTKHFRATAIMASVSDPQVRNNLFTSGSDWFSFAILAFQLFIGIHPYKGKHPTIKGMEDRMKASVSVFDSSVSLPSVCYPMDVIPPVYRDWFKAVLQDHKRVEPPSDLQAVAPVTTKLTRAIVSSQSLVVQLLRSFGETGDILKYFSYVSSVGMEIAQTSQWLFLGPSQYPARTEFNHVGFTPEGQPVCCRLKGNHLVMTPPNGSMANFDTHVDEVSTYQGRVYARSGSSVLEISFSGTQHADGSPNVVAVPRVVCSVMTPSIQLFSGGILSSMLGDIYVSLFPRTKASFQVRLAELDGYKILEAKFDSGVLMVMCAKKGVYDRFVFRFSDDYSTYDSRRIPNVSLTGLNFVVLDSGVCVCLTEEDNLELFSSKKDAASIKVVEDKVLGGDMKLVKLKGRLGFIRGNSVYEMRMQ